jgi:hypothetical protein
MRCTNFSVRARPPARWLPELKGVEKTGTKVGAKIEIFWTDGGYRETPRCNDVSILANA